MQHMCRQQWLQYRYDRRVTALQVQPSSELHEELPVGEWALDAGSESVIQRVLHPFDTRSHL